MQSADMGALLRRHRILALTVFDGFMWMVASALASVVRLEFDPDDVSWSGVALLSLTLIMLYLALGSVFRLHQGRATLATVDETVLLAIVAVASGLVVFVANLFLLAVPRTVPLLTAFLALALMVLGRATYRAAALSEARRAAEGREHRVIVVGAGDGGRQVISSMLRTPDAEWLPVAVLDDDHRKRHLRIRGVPVRGAIGDLGRVARAEDVEAVVVAIPSGSRELFQRVSTLAADAGLQVKVLPSVAELFGASVDIRDLRDINLNDVLGRQQVDTNLAEIASNIAGKRVLVTGAGGSIGSELCRQLTKFDPGQLLMLDRDESALHAVQLSIYGHALLDSPDIVLCDIRDSEALEGIFAARRPEVVFHAAALKHLPMLEQYPVEGFKTNVLGTLNVLRAAANVNAERFVNISTDKAANPTSVLGYTKRLAEGLTASMSQEASGTYLSVRFGNVLGSRGSVLETFARQISIGGPVTVTHPEVTRYFMTIPEAVQLVIQAAAIGLGGEALVLDMGKPIRIDYVAKELIRLSGRPVRVKYTGLRDGEKLHEDLLGREESENRTIHPLINNVVVPPVHPDELVDLTHTTVADCIAELQTVVHRMTEQNSSRNVN